MEINGSRVGCNVPYLSRSVYTIIQTGNDKDVVASMVIFVHLSKIDAYDKRRKRTKPIVHFSTNCAVPTPILPSPAISVKR